jgi:hypothetical protein
MGEPRLYGADQFWALIRVALRNHYDQSERISALFRLLSIENEPANRLGQ